MGVNTITILTFLVILSRALGTYPFRTSNFPHPASFHAVKETSDTVTISKDYDLELLKPMSQMPQMKHVPLYLIPQTSFHVYPTNTRHVPAIQIPLTEPIVVTDPMSDLVVPMGFTVFFRGSFCPFYTVALVAPVPPGTHASSDSPVVIHALYAIPKMPQAHKKVSASHPTATASPQIVDVDSDTVALGDDTVSVPFDEVDEQLPFENAKESPYLQELRLESLQRQVQELQAKIRKIKRLKKLN